MTVNRKNSDQFQLRLPNGLRARIKAYAAAHNRSLNAEIVRVLEREFPEPWEFEDKIESISELMAGLTNSSDEEKLSELAGELEETMEGIVSGRIMNVSQETRDRVAKAWERYKQDQFEKLQDSYSIEMDPAEVDVFGLVGRTDKFIKITQTKLKDTK